MVSPNHKFRKKKEERKNREKQKIGGSFSSPSHKMAVAGESSEKSKEIGLDKVTADLTAVIHEVAMKYPANALVHQLKYVVASKIKTPAHLEAAFAFFASIGSGDFKLNEFEEACSVGVEVPQLFGKMTLLLLLLLLMMMLTWVTVPRMNGRTLIVLSIDGGGVRGIIPAKVLTYLEGQIQEIHGQDACLANYFDVVAGTSTGSLIAAMLITPSRDNHRTPLYNTKEILLFYKDNAPDNGFHSYADQSTTVDICTGL